MRQGRGQHLSTPLCPAGHLPRKGGDWSLHRRGSSCNVGDWRGEMSGRTEGGVKDRHPLLLAGLTHPKSLF
ncbi:MAG: hypothetical protein E5Y02_28880 [Mesorhizobium sp.]|nr:MAG: hypothetical protein E5Y02_28880 [Mesorhizobium sp.]